MADLKEAYLPSLLPPPPPRKDECQRCGRGYSLHENGTKPGRVGWPYMNLACSGYK